MGISAWSFPSFPLFAFNWSCGREMKSFLPMLQFFLMKVSSGILPAEDIAVMCGSLVYRLIGLGRKIQLGGLIHDIVGGSILKIAVTGKGGVGKTTLSAFLVRWFAERGKSVLAIDADPDANLAHALGIKNASEITPVSQMRELVAERTESVPGSYGGFFKLNPKVDDLPEKLSVRQGENIRLMVMGGIKKGGTGCVCPESVLLKNLVQHLY